MIFYTNLTSKHMYDFTETWTPSQGPETQTSSPGKCKYFILEYVASELCLWCKDFLDL